MLPSGASARRRGLCSRQPALRWILPSWRPQRSTQPPAPCWRPLLQGWPRSCRECAQRPALPFRRTCSRLARPAKRRQRRRLAQPQPSGSSAQAWR